MPYFKTAIKIARGVDEDEFLLTKNRLFLNAEKRICTSLLLDTNILLSISNYMAEVIDKPSEEALNRYNLSEFVDFCLFCQHNNLPFSLSPGFCIPEVAPNNFNNVLNRYNQFFGLHGIYVLDDPSGRDACPILQMHDILSLPSDEIKLRALPFLNLCAMLIVESDQTITNPITRYDMYIELVKEYIGLFSEKELCIASIVLGDFLKNHKDRFDEESEDLVKKVVNNFARTKKQKRPRNSEEAIKIAFNGASDLTMINVAVAGDGEPIDSVSMDVWLMSNDAKLFGFLAKLFGYRILIPGQNGMFAEISLPKGFETCMVPFTQKVYTQKMLLRGNRQFVRMDSDLWVVRIQEMLTLLKQVFG